MMISSTLKRLLPRTLAVLALLLALSMLVLAQNAASPAAARTDGQIEMDAVHALDGAQQLKDDLVTVATIQGEVTLSGTVVSQANKDLAQSLVAKISGVAKVQNNLKVGDPKQASIEPQMDPGTDSVAEDQAYENQQQAQAAQQNSGEQAGAAQSQEAYPQQQQRTYGRQAYARPQQPAYPIHNQQPAYRAATGPVTIAPGANLVLRTSGSLDTKHAKDGAPVDFLLMQDVAVNGVLAIPRGATFHGFVAESKQAGTLAGSAELSLQLTSVDLGGQNYPLQTEAFLVKGPNKAGHTVGNALAGGLIGTIIGCAAGRGVGCAIGAGAGVAAGTAASAASSGPNVWIPAEARVDFRLSQPLTVNPVSAEEAQRMAQGITSGGPTLYQRGYDPNGAYPPPPPYYVANPYGYGSPYGYAPVYYRPYYMVGEYHYWR
jgi:hypothetical protein